MTKATKAAQKQQQSAKRSQAQNSARYSECQSKSRSTLQRTCSQCALYCIILCEAIQFRHIAEKKKSLTLQQTLLCVPSVATTSHLVGGPKGTCALSLSRVLTYRKVSAVRIFVYKNVKRFLKCDIKNMLDGVAGKHSCRSRRRGGKQEEKNRRKLL
jgi:hypothetical protein